MVIMCHTGHIGVAHDEKGAITVREEMVQWAKMERTKSSVSSFITMGSKARRKVVDREEVWQAGRGLADFTS